MDALIGAAPLTLAIAAAAVVLGVLYARARGRAQRAASELRDAREELERERRARGRLERSQRSLQTAVETLRLGVTVTDLDNRIVYVNPAEAEMHGYGRDELLGKNARLYGYGDRNDLDPEPPPVRFWERESVNVRRDGSRFPVRLVSDVVKDSDGRPTGLLTICEDLSERRAAERIKEDFVASVSHELRTPLTSIVASLDLLDDPGSSADAQRRGEMIEIAQRNSRRLLRLVDDLLVLQKLRAGRVDFRLESLPVRPLLEAAIGDFQPQARARSVLLELAEVDDDVRVVADRDRLQQVLSNLLSNAIKYSPAGVESRVEVATEPRAGRVSIAVSDQGPGIPEESLDHLFEPFHRVDPGAQEGTGLGLSIVKRLVQGMNGAVTVDSRVDRGTTLKVILPAAD